MRERGRDEREGMATQAMQKGMYDNTSKNQSASRLHISRGDSSLMDTQMNPHRAMQQKSTVAVLWL